MALEKNKIISNDALNVPLEMAENMDTLLLKLKETIQTLGALNQSFSKNPGVKESKKNTDELTNSQKELAKVFKQIETAQARLTPEYDKQNKKLIELRTAQAQRNKQLRDEAKATQQNLGPLEQLNQKRLQAQTRLKNLIAAEELHGRATKRSTQEIQRAQVEFNKLDKSFIRVQRSARQFGDNVGNYPKMLGSATNAVKGFIGAFGLIGGIQLFARTIRDAFQRVRDFDREVVNLAAIAGKTRPQIKSLEKEIITVAGSSIKTANEVAGLATELIKLGSTTQEAEKLLKPVNDFAIALRASSEESASFLKGVLNAFGVGAEEAGRFGDVLSSAANKSALDFQGLNESFGYVAPTARALNIPIERLAAQIGTLADNNIKASRAGRLLNTSFARLVSQGKTLDSALNEIRNSTDKVATANRLFGAESFNIGLILADNEDKVNRLTKEFENSKGSLEELTNKQLKSLDAQLKILDSSWEAFILKVESGEGALGKAFVGLVANLSSVLNGLTLMGERSDLFWKGLTAASDETIDALLQTGHLVTRTNRLLGYVGGNFQLTKGIEGYTTSIKDLLSTVTEGVSDETIFNNLRHFEKEFVKVLVNSGVELEKASVLAVRWGQSFKASFQDAANTVTEEAPQVVDFLQEFAKALADLNINTLTKLKNDLQLLQAQKQALFDRTGNEGFKTEVEEIGNQIKLVQNAIAALGNVSANEIKALRPKFKKAFDEINKAMTESVEKSMDDQVKAVEDAMEARIIAMNKALEKERQIADARKTIDTEVKNFSLNTIQEVSNAIFAASQIRLENEMRNLSVMHDLETTRLQQQINNAEEGSQRRAQLEERLIEKKEQFAKKEAEIRQRQAKMAKTQALVEIAINTARAVMQAYANVNPLVVAPLVALAVAAGGIQAALVAAQPLPQYESGTKDSAKDFIAGEGKGGKAFELVKNNKGTFLTKGPTLFKDMPHSTVYNHEDTLKILNSSLMSGLMINESQGTYQDAELRRDLNKGFSKVAKEIRKKPTMIVSGVVGKQVSGTRIRKLNALRGL